MLKRTILLILLLTLTMGCPKLDSILTTRGVITTKISVFDNTRIVRMSPSLTNTILNTMGDVSEFGLYWEESYENTARLVVREDGIVNFKSDKNIDFRVDEYTFSLQPIDSLDSGKAIFGAYNEFSGYAPNYTEKGYLISKEQILQIANVRGGAFRIYFRDGYRDYQFEGQVNKDYQSFTSKAFKNFYNTVWGSEYGYYYD